jgi:Tol biopolymer transport system component
MSRVPGAGRFVVLAVLLLAVQPLTSAQATSTPAATSLTLTSAGSDGVAGRQDSGQAVLAANGTQTAFTSAAALRTTASVHQTPEESPPQNDRVYARNRLTGATTLVSDARQDESTAPAISRTGRVIAYQTESVTDGDDEIDVVDRLATGKGTFDTRTNLVVRQVTGNQGDPRLQRIQPCPFGEETPATGRCGPALSQDATTLAYPAQLAPVSPALTLSEFGDGEADVPITDNIVDMVSFEELGRTEGATEGTEEVTVIVTNTSRSPIRFTGLPTVSQPFSLASSCGTPNAPVLAVGATCQINLEFDASENCLFAGSEQVFTGDLATNATTPAGQSDVTVVAACGDTSFITGTPLPPPTDPGPRIAQPAFSAPTGCAPVPDGLPVRPISPNGTDNQNVDVADAGPVEVGRPEIAWTTVSDYGTFDFTSPDCSLRLIDPTTVPTGTPLPTDVPPPCGAQPVATFSSGDVGCTAYFLVDPRQVATSAGLVRVTECGDGCSTQGTYVTATGVRNVIVARHGPNFAASRGTVVSVDGAGDVMPDATNPALSADGRFLAFTAPVPLGQPGRQPVSGTEVWRHDTAAGPTVLVSCLPGACRQAATASAPSISGDGARIAFLGQPVAAVPGQVYVREVDAGATLLVSSDRHRGTSAADGAARDPVISPDGATVAFGSVATDLLGQPPPGAKPAANLFVADIGPGTPGIMLVTPAGSLGIRPSLDEHGRLVAFESTGRLLPSAPSRVDSVYTFERFGHLVVAPGAVTYGRLIAGLPGQTRGVTVTNTGPGPVTFTGVTITGPYVLTLESCAGTVLHTGQQCRAIILFRPVAAGRPGGLLTWTTADDGEVPQHTTVGVTATVVVPAAPLLTVSPTVAYGGEVVRATGVAFPATATITLTWDKGLGVTKATTDANGVFSVDVVLFPDDMIGARTLQAAGPTGTRLATTPFLASAAPEEPPFHQAGR